MLDHLSSVSITELKEIRGGISISGALIKELVAAGKAILNMGRSFGVSLRTLLNRRFCSRR